MASLACGSGLGAPGTWRAPLSWAGREAGGKRGQRAGAVAGAGRVVTGVRRALAACAPATRPACAGQHSAQRRGCAAGAAALQDALCARPRNEAPFRDTVPEARCPGGLQR